MEAKLKRIGNVNDQQLKEDILSGKRSDPLGAMTNIEMNELVDLINESGGIALLNGTVLSTNRVDLHDKYIADYVLRKMALVY